MKSNNNYRSGNNYKNDNASIIYIIFFVLLFWCIFAFSCTYTGVIPIRREYFSSNSTGEYLTPVRYSCDDENQIKSNSPQICCKFNNGSLQCNYMQNCKCKNKDTGYCETCYPRIVDKNEF